MKGWMVGIFSAVLATALGVYYAWRGFASHPYDGRDLGLFFGTLGAITGGLWGILGALAGRWMTSAASTAPRA